MKKLIVSALAIYGGIKLGEKLLKRYRKPIIDWVGKKAKEAADRIIDDILAEEVRESPKAHECKASHSPYTKSTMSRYKDYAINYENEVVMIQGVTMEEAIHILKSLREVLKEYKRVTTLDLNNVSRVDFPSSSFGYGWDCLDEAFIQTFDNGKCILTLPNLKKFV